VERFDALLERNDSGGHLVALPFDAKQVFGRVRVPVRATVNGHTFRSTLMRYGGTDYLGLNGEAREGAGVETGQRITVELQVDDEPRVVEVPPELSDALAGDEEANMAFERLSYTHRREFAEWIAEAKRDETRERRLTQTLALLREGKHR
jgi:Bacteriocin-protection, YdeI or OmpD-Associated/Domain of unknown function (DUF1905)